MMTSKRVLVTGATGFLGQRVVPLLREAGFAVTSAGSRAPEGSDAAYLQLDLTRRESVERALSEWRWDSVVHLAGPVSHAASRGWDDERDQMLAHVRIAMELCRAIPRDWSGRCIHASSMTIYGPAAALPVAENAARRPIHAYGAAKVLAEDVFAAFGPRDTWVLRFPGLFSPDRRGGGLFHFMKAARAGESIQVNAPSAVSWDLLLVDDAAEAVLRALRSPEAGPGPINVSYGEIVELEGVARRIAAMAEPPVDVVAREDVKHPPFQMDVARARTLLGAWPPRSLDDRLAELWRAWA